MSLVLLTQNGLLKGLRGCSVRISGKLYGQRRNRKTVVKGSIRYTGQQNLEKTQQHIKIVKTKMGIIGIKVVVSSIIGKFLLG